ncbi:MAG: molybdopterin-dependent oxidoreductase [Polyangiaceae bacterium]|nr:molybdopterin-dependent oxidoreductase [Polyangiaceae bacterium]
MLHGALLRSPVPHARIAHLDTRRAAALPGVKAVVVGSDLPAVRYGNWRLVPTTQDELALARDKVRFVGDEVAAVAAVDRDTAEEALALIRVEYEPLPAVFDLDAAMAAGAPVLHEATPDNVSVTRKIAFGDLEAGFGASDYVREDTFTVQAVSHAYLEPCATLAQADDLGRITLTTSTQTPYIVQCLLASTLGLRENEVRVVKPAVGGGFGGKMELRPWDVCAAFIARRTGKPVKFTLSREEELATGRRRHPMRLRSRVGFKRDGTLMAKDFQVLLEGGAYNSMGPTATFLVGNFGAMLYRYPAYRYAGAHVYTNHAPAGAMRGFGAPQALFATETQMNMAAEALGIDPIELRLKNAMRPGDEIPDVATVGTCGFSECLERVAEMSGWREKRSQGPGKGGGKGLGIGCYSFITGGVFNWFNTPYPFSAAEVRAYADGTVHLLTMASDIGQGSDTVLQQILAEELGIRMQDIHMTAGDTAMTPKGDLGTWGSRVTLMAGNAVLEAARQVKEELARMVSLRFDLNVVQEVELKDGMVRSKFRPDRGIPFAEAVAMAQKANRGKPVIGRGTYTPRDMGLVTPTFSFGAQVAEVDVDRETGVTRVTKVYTAHDCGTVLNPMAVDGQVHGCIQMGMGYALSEELVMRDGKTVNASFLDYKMPGALDMPECEAVCVETHDPRGPFGAKETGEGPISATAPAIADAVWHASGHRATALPITAEKLLAALDGDDSVAGERRAEASCAVPDPRPRG